MSSHIPRQNRHRRILPTPAERPPITPGASASSSDQTTRRATRQQAPAACQECRKQKTKCSAHRPKCLRCWRLSKECVYDTAQLETPRQSLQRKHGELEARNSNLEHLFGFLRDGPEADVATVVRRLREGADLDNLGMHIRDGDLLLQMAVRPDMTYIYTFPYAKNMPAALAQDSSIPYVKSLLCQNTVGLLEHPQNAREEEQDWQKVYRIPFHGVELVDPRIERIHGSRWTFITVADSITRRLVRLYFILQHPFYTFFQKNLFLEDLASGRERYCTPLLFNAVMAEACHSYSAISERYRFWDPKKLTYQFMAEARRLWEIEMKSREDRITTVQASMVLCAGYSTTGLDQLGADYLVQGTRMAERMQIFGSLDHVKNPFRRKVYAMTAWALFGYQGMFAFHMWQQPLLTEPPMEPLADVSLSTEKYGEVWVKYPHSQSLTPVHFGESFVAFSQLRTIMGQIADLAARKRAQGLKFTAADAALFRTTLVAWFNSLPPFLSPEYVTLPAHLKIHLQYHNIMLGLYDSLADQSDVSPTATYREICVHSRRCLDVLLRLYYLRHGFESWNDSLPTWLLFLAQLCVRDLAQQDDPLSDEATVSTLMLCAKGLQDQGRSLYIARVFFKMLRLEMPPAIMHELDSHVTEMDGDDSSTGTGAHHLRASWPVKTISISEEPDHLWERLSLEDRRIEGPEEEDEDETAIPSSDRGQ
ncbi:Nitrogen assimilation transcription factor nit-4 like protein [Verticillium longisporum]|uniref:Nitrogen assimilation transcription factor nit-4 like protein n=1 Tax=Verticillium longisporum TaxID=100787 RepID=A0A8I2Z7Y7_VERLO|nr:Nitrogen assimilation transcription factor nit-4 like protein [Verticillium longisporum]